MNPALLLLIIAVPLGSAALSVMVRSRALDAVLLTAVPALIGAVGVWLLVALSDGGVIAHSVGGYVQGLAIPFVADSFTALMLVITALASLVCAIFLITTGEDQYRFVPALILMMLAGVDGALLTGDMFNFFVFVEVMVLPSYALIAVTGTWRRLGVGRTFVIVNLLTSTLLLVGVGFVYAALGTVNVGALARLAAEGRVTPAGSLGFGVVLTALLIKAGAMPVHGWLVRTYPNTSAGMMALFSALHTKVALYGIYRFTTALYPERPGWDWALTALVVLTVVGAAISAFGPERVRNVLAFQMTAGVGSILIGIAVYTQAALAAGMFYLVHHILTMVGLLLTIGAVEQTYGTGAFKKLSGLAAREKWAAALMVLGLFSLIGLPPTSGLWGKLGLVRAVAASGQGQAGLLIAAIVTGSLITLLVLQRLWANTFWGAPMQTYHPDSPHTGRSEATELPDGVRIRPRLLVPGTIMVSLSVALFCGAQVLVPITQRAAAGLLDPTRYIQAVMGL
ncbi:monovalent cation/H+ antiporter subunit D family protein [Brevibacterium sp. 5221]|uniref:Monovalent cation/H+ antiporter subunit D family protein n=1 Tax=Brevibacterium rongguiense TaxID=2695267 RepID=A0A6N9H5L7_9MICO|nr:monovalent cation/H+ antiporter subunit D family protein [Brevibacterium rongguiense]MYM19141.1 monovalent cation/H+ antiporter subunit D family protein [Brevibacterium rongguiense]